MFLQVNIFFSRVQRDSLSHFVGTSVGLSRVCFFHILKHFESFLSQLKKLKKKKIKKN